MSEDIIIFMLIAGNSNPARGSCNVPRVRGTREITSHPVCTSLVVWSLECVSKEKIENVERTCHSKMIRCSRTHQLGHGIIRYLQLQLYGFQQCIRFRGHACRASVSTGLLHYQPYLPTLPTYFGYNYLSSPSMSPLHGWSI